VSYIAQSLISGESVLYRTRLHWIVLVVPIIIGSFFGLAGLMFIIGAIKKIGDPQAAPGTLAGVGLLFAVVAAAIIGFGFLYRSSTEMAVTTKRVMIKTGLLSRMTVEIMLTKVESVSVDQSIWGRILGYGSIVVRGTGGTPEPFAKIAHPLEFRRQLQEQSDRIQETKAASANA
jgi:uncharacterized membrane protein YdbT with pleckstrin-like domain